MIGSRFTGEQTDTGAQRGLVYLRARHYDPALGRFLSQDPLPFAQRYAYVGNNPANYTDPSGMHCRAYHPHHCSPVDIYGAVSTGVQVADLIPLGVVPLLNIPLTVGSVPLDIVAAAFAEGDILLSNCSTKKKFGLTLNNVANLGVGVGGQLLSDLATPSVVGSVVIGIETSAVETTLYLGAREALERCGENVKDDGKHE